MNETLSTITKRSRKLRSNPTPTELELWKYLRKRQFYGLRFLRQHPIKFSIDNKVDYFIVDFYCHDYKIVIELDGEIHKKQKDYDEMREGLLKEMGFIIIRFKNREILENVEEVLNKIKKLLFENRPVL
ncbi:DUF559 domain-containing protein [Candidatus Parcubacteria bacterium]|nr:DUF559 domain-containing protein [Candidatus Parcubacteria bacterium]